MGHDPLGLQIPHLLARNLSTGDLSTRTPPVAADSVISGISYLDTSNNKHAKENEKENAKKEKLREKLKKKMLLPHLLTRPKTSKSAEFANIIPYNPCFGSPTTKMPTSTQKTPIKDKSPRTETVQQRNPQLGDTLTERSFLLPLSTHPSPSSSIVSDGRYGDSSDADSTDVYSSRSSQPDWDACSEITSIHSASLSLHPARYDRLTSTVSPTPTPHRRPQHVVVSLSKSVNNPNTVHVLSNTNDLTSNSQTFQTPLLLEPGSSISTCTFSSPRESVVVNATSSTKTISYPGSSAVASYSSKVSPSAMLLSSPSKIDELYDIQEMDYEGEEFQLDISPGTPLGDTEDQMQQQQQQEQEQGQERERGRAREQELFGRNSKKKWSFLKAKTLIPKPKPIVLKLDNADAVPTITTTSFPDTSSKKSASGGNRTSPQRSPQRSPNSRSFVPSPTPTSSFPSLSPDDLGKVNAFYAPSPHLRPLPPPKDKDKDKDKEYARWQNQQQQPDEDHEGPVLDISRESIHFSGGLTGYPFPDTTVTDSTSTTTAATATTATMSEDPCISVAISTPPSSYEPSLVVDSDSNSTRSDSEEEVRDDDDEDDADEDEDEGEGGEAYGTYEGPIYFTIMGESDRASSRTEGGVEMIILERSPFDEDKDVGDKTGGGRGVVVGGGGVGGGGGVLQQDSLTVNPGWERNLKKNNYLGMGKGKGARLAKHPPLPMSGTETTIKRSNKGFGTVGSTTSGPNHSRRKTKTRSPRRQQHGVGNKDG